MVSAVDNLIRRANNPVNNPTGSAAAVGWRILKLNQSPTVSSGWAASRARRVAIGSRSPGKTSAIGRIGCATWKR